MLRELWKNIFDWNRGFMRPKKNGGWYSPFDPFEVNSNYTEANAWQYLFAVPQDINGLISIMGGNEKFEAKLDSLFSVSSKTTGREQSDITGLIGQYAHGNEPSHHMAYLYNFIGKPWKTQQRVKQIMNEMYHDAPDGLSGNEDCGQMSAWYVMNAMGLYEVTPGNPIYVTTTPSFSEVKLHLESGMTFIRNDADSRYFIRHEQIMTGEKSSLDSIVAETGGIGKSFGKWDIAPTILVDPVIQSSGNSFSDKMNVSILSYSPEAKIYFTQDGLEPTLLSKKYSKPFTINSTQTIKAIVINKYENKSKVVTASFHKTNKNWKVTYLTKYNPQYTGSGDQCLIDEESGTKDFRNGQWQGWWGDDMELIVDLGKESSVSKVGAEFLQNQSPWIFFPKVLEVLFSSDGINFHDDVNAVTSSDYLLRTDSIQTITLQTPVKNIKARYIKIIAHNYGKLPSWHVSAGSDAWIFCDEIVIE